MADSQDMIGVEGGTAIFQSTTNVSGVEVTGKSTALSARVEVLQKEDSLILQKIEATVPVQTLATGMKVRDEHMRKYIFTDSEGKEPDLKFTADAATRPAVQPGTQIVCRVTGSLSIRGVPRPLQMTLRIKEQSASSLAFRVEGEGVAKLSDYGISAPSQFGVKSKDEVKLRVEFNGKQTANLKAALTGAP